MGLSAYNYQVEKIVFIGHFSGALLLTDRPMKTGRALDDVVASIQACKVLRFHRTVEVSSSSQRQLAQCLSMKQFRERLSIALTRSTVEQMLRKLYLLVGDKVAYVLMRLWKDFNIM